LPDLLSVAAEITRLLELNGSPRPIDINAWHKAIKAAPRVPSSTVIVCGACLAVLGGGGEKLTCSRIAVYCSPACQRAAWPSHKRLCKRRRVKGLRVKGSG